MNTEPAVRQQTEDLAGPSKGPYYVRAVGKAVLVLEALADGPADLTLAEICRRVRLNRATAYRLLATLERHHFVQRTELGTYRLGLSLMALGGAVQRQSVLAEHASPHMRDLARSLDMTSVLSVLDGDEALCLQRMEAGGMLVVRFRPGEHLPLHTGAGPLLLLASLADPEVDRILSRPLVAFTPRTICEPAEIRALLTEARRDGVAYSDEDVTLGVGAIGAKVASPRGETVAALSVTAVVGVLFGRRKAEIVQAVQQTAHAIGATLG